jgi:predicted  nucleic acid-binding Zn-ribbon protein
MSEGMPISDQFKEAIAELEGIKKQLTEAQKAIKVLKDREASLKTFIGGYMTAQKIDDVQTRGGTKVTQKTSIKKPVVTKKILMDELPNYIEGGQERLEQIIKEIEEKLEPKETSTLQLKLKK